MVSIGTSVRSWYPPAKRLMDVAMSAAGLIALSPLFVLIAAAVAVESGLPVLYRPEVRGQGGRPFRLLKFRTMVPDARRLLEENPDLLGEYQRTLKIKSDPRITRVGRLLRKTSLDELPQLLNVLAGEMSLVGPRVLSDIELARYGEFGARVLSVRPGVTGLWQVSGRHTVPFERRMELDGEYLDRRGFWLDLRILLKTVPAVLSGRGAG